MKWRHPIVSSQIFRLKVVHESIEECFEKDADLFSADLDQWSQRFGPQCAYKWPTFEVIFFLHLVSLLPPPPRFNFLIWDYPGSGLQFCALIVSQQLLKNTVSAFYPNLSHHCVKEGRYG